MQASAGKMLIFHTTARRRGGPAFVKEFGALRPAEGKSAAIQPFSALPVSAYVHLPASIN